VELDDDFDDVSEVLNALKAIATPARRPTTPT